MGADFVTRGGATAVFPSFGGCSMPGGVRVPTKISPDVTIVSDTAM
jgi:hypothetical protein